MKNWCTNLGALVVMGFCATSAGCLDVEETDSVEEATLEQGEVLACGNGIPCADPGPTVIGPVQPPGPDLAPISIECLGSTARITFKNVGNVGITQQWHYTITRSHGLPIGPSIGQDPLPAQATYAIVIPSGKHQAFHVKADSLGAIAEANEANNWSSTQCP